MPTAYDFADSENELFTFGDKTFYDAIHGVGVFEEFNPDGEYVPNIYLLSKSIQSKNILEIPILKAQLMTKTIVTSGLNLEILQSELENNKDFALFCQK